MSKLSFQVFRIEPDRSYPILLKYMEDTCFYMAQVNLDSDLKT